MKRAQQLKTVFTAAACPHTKKHPLPPAHVRRTCVVQVEEYDGCEIVTTGNSSPSSDDDKATT